jgi:hypothetical protein
MNQPLPVIFWHSISSKWPILDFSESTSLGSVAMILA